MVAVKGMAETSFGPYGRTKLLRGESGAVVVTRDCSQILAHQFKSTEFKPETLSQHGPLSYLVEKACQSHAEQFGDGTMSLYLLMTSILNHFFSNGSLAAGCQRVDMLLAVNKVIFAFNCCMESICEDLTKASIMQKINDKPLDVIRGLILNMLVPASNSSIGQNLANIVTSWYKGSAITLESKQIIQEILKNFDTYFVTSSLGNLSDSYVVPRNQVVIEGNCPDDNFLSPQRLQNKSCSFICIGQFISDDSVGNTTLVLSGGYSDLQSKVDYDANTGFMITVLKLVAEHKIQVIFSSTSYNDISSSVLYHLSSHGIMLISSVPSFQLRHLGKVFGVPVFNDSYSFVEVLSHCHQSAFGEIEGVEKITMGPRSSQTYLRIHGSELKTAHNHTCQVVMRGCASSTLSGMYKRLLKRCLRILQSLCSADRVDFLLPGCGICEMTFSVIWDEVVRHLECATYFEEEGDVLSPLKCVAIKFCYVLLHQHNYHGIDTHQPLSVTAMICEVDKIKLRLSKGCLQSLIDIGKSISLALFQIPQALLRNHANAAYSSNSGFINVTMARNCFMWKRHFVSTFLYRQAERANLFIPPILFGILDNRFENNF